MMQFLKPLPPTSEGKTFVLKSKVIGVYDKGKAGSVLETENLIVDKNTGEVRQRHTPWLGDKNRPQACL